MSLQVQTTSGNYVDAHFIGMYPIEGVQVGDYEMSMSNFCEMAQHFLSGGFFGWQGGETPEPVSDTLTTLFNTYEQQDGKWVRKR